MMILLVHFFSRMMLFLSCISSSIILASADDVDYQSFTETTPMPYPLSDMTATIFEDLGRIYLVGGCTKNQDCSLGATSCYCPEITNGCIYFRLSDESWSKCSPAPRARFRHMGNQSFNDVAKFLFNV
jgi:hypothetical protein